jgi:hypothetical protein
MAYGVKYRIAYYRKSEGITTIDFLEKDYSGAVTNLLAYGDPLQIDFSGDAANIFKPTVGSGATIKCISPSPLALLEVADSIEPGGLFTDDPQKFIVKIYNGASGSTLMWQGFINAEMYNESYCNPFGDVITINCNDGMQVLDFIPYKQHDGSYYTGNESIGEILNHIFSKLGITFKYIDMSNDIELQLLGINNLFLYVQVANENFIDESGDAMTCREVLNSIFGGYGLVMSLKGDSIRVIDPINLHDPSKGTRYTVSLANQYYIVSTGSVTANFGGYLNISDGDIIWYQTGMELDINPAVAEVTINYNPYNFYEYNYDFHDQDNWSAEGVWYDESDMAYGYNPDIRFNNWSTTNPGPFAFHGTNFIGLRENYESEPIYAVIIEAQPLEDYIVTWNIPLSNITQDSNMLLKISVDVYVHTKVAGYWEGPWWNPEYVEEGVFNLWSEGTTTPIHQLKIPIRVRIGDHYWDGWSSWVLEPDPSSGIDDDLFFKELIVRQEGVSAAEVRADMNKSIINDTWTTSSITINFSDLEEPIVSGNISIEILSNCDFFDQWVLPWTTAAEEAIRFVLMKDFKVEFIDAKTGKNVGNDGVETKATLNSNLTGKDPYEIKTTTGTGPYGCSRGAFKCYYTWPESYPPWQNMTGVYRKDLVGESTEDRYTLEELALQSIGSQYKHPRFILRGDLDVSINDILLEVDMKLIQDTAHLPGKSFFIYNGIYHDREEYMEVEMIELTSLRDPIE